MTELLIVSATAGLAEALGSYDGLQLITAASLNRAAQLVASEHPPQAVYVEDLCGTTDELWRLARLALGRQIPLLAGIRSGGTALAADLLDAGVAVTEQHDRAFLAGWIATQLGARSRAGKAQVTIAVAGAKGGIGKSLVVALLAEGMRRRGLRVLVVDGDLSNSGLVPTFRIPSGFPSYLHIPGDAAHSGTAAWTPENLRRYIYHHEPSTIDFLLGSEETTDARDMQRPEWMALMQAVRGLGEYDVVLLDTGPEIKKRPYAILAARDGGWIVLPTPPGRKERTGAGNMLRALQAAVPGRDLTERCFLLFMDPERGAAATVKQVQPLFARHFPHTRPLGRLPRCPQQVSAADEQGDRYISPFDLAPHGRLACSAHQLVNQLCAEVGLRPPHAMPRSSLWQRLRGNQLASECHATANRTMIDLGEASV
jgi:cellulose biosynthesis protein BcsQ